MTRALGPFASLGLRFVVHANHPAIAGRIAQLYGACCTADPRAPDLDLVVDFDAGSGAFELRANGERCCLTTDRDELLAWVVWRVNDAAVNHDDDRLVLHAAAVATGEHAVLLAGRSGAGKSTLATALTLSGFAYMSDDSVAFDQRSGSVVANPKPISLDAGALAALGRLDSPPTESSGLIAPESIGAVVSAGDARGPVLVVQPRYRAGADLHLVPLSQADVAELLADQSFNFARRGRAGLAAVATIARATHGFALDYDDLRPAVATIKNALA